MIRLHSASTRRGSRRGVALLIVVVLIGLFAMLCHALAMLVAMQHRLAFQSADQAQVHRLAEAGLLRAVAQIHHHPGWSGEDWSPSLPGGETVVVEIRRDNQAGRTSLRSEARLTTTRGVTRKSLQTLAFPAVPAATFPESTLP